MKYEICRKFYQNLETLKAKKEVDIILGVFSLNAQDPQLFQHIPSVFSNLQLLSHNCSDINGSQIDQVFVAKSFLQTKIFAIT